jgi:hypothetical protein
MYSCPEGSRARGVQCIDIDECREWAPCQNGGRCRDMVPGFRCLCTEGFAGPTCVLKLLPATTITPSADFLAAIIACILALISNNISYILK